MLFSFVRLVAITTAHGVAYGVRRGMYGRDIDPGDLGRLRGTAAAALLERLGPTFVKLGQVLSTRPDVIGTEVARGLARLQERVGAVPPPVALRALRDGLGRDPAEVFASIEPEPIASGSIAQVHRAITSDGRHVVVKIRRPDVCRRIEADVSLLVWVVTICERLGLRFPARPWLVQFTDAVCAQLDLAREADSYRQLRVNLAGLPGIRVPEVLPELTTTSVLTMEYVGDLHHVDSEELPPEDRRRALHAGLAALYQMIFIDGFIHADLHPGNIFFRRGGECVLLDAGVVARLDHRVRRDFVDFFYGLVANRGDVCARVIYDNALYCGSASNRHAFDTDVSTAVACFSALPASEFEVTAFAMTMFDLQHRHEIYSAPDFMMAIVALLSYEGIVKRVQPDLNFQAMALEVLPRAMALAA